jgi:hypothetical protein
MLGLGQPRPDREIKLIQSRLVYVHPHALLKRECQTRYAVIELDRRNVEIGLHQKTRGRQRLHPERLAIEFIACLEPRPRQPVPEVPLCSDDSEIPGRLIQEIPRVGPQLCLDGICQTGRTEYLQLCLPIKEQTEHPVKARKVVHMHVRHEHLPDPGNRPSRKRSQVAEIEKDGTRFEAEIKQEACIAERLIDQPGLYKKNHTVLRRTEELRPNCLISPGRNLAVVDCRGSRSSQAMSRPPACLCHHSAAASPAFS